MARAVIQIRKFIILTHRWMGVVLCLLFAMWFASGIVLMYWNYPEVDARERLAHSQTLDASKFHVTPQQAFAELGPSLPPDRVRADMLGGRPVYRFSWGSSQLIVYADDGRMLTDVPRDLALRIASNWTGLPPADATFEGALQTADQWTVSGEFRPLRPLFKFSWPDGEQVYVSGVTAEVVQATTRASRTGAYFGAIPHWLYFTPLRRHGALWSKVVIACSGAGIAMTIFGLVAGLWYYSPSKKRYRFPQGASGVPFAGLKRWHTELGLIFGLFAFSWVMSGMLSMDPFGWDSGADSPQFETALRGASWNAAAFAGEYPRAALGQVPDLRVKELELAFFAGQPVYIARESPQRSRIIPVKGDPSAQFDPARVAALFQTASRHRLAEVRVVRQYESYYIDRSHRLPLPALFVRLDDAQGSTYYVDLNSARIVESYATIGRWNRWLYHGLHSFDLPWLYRHRPAWDLLMLVLLAGGAAVSVTAVVIGWRRVHRRMFKGRRIPA
jgi:hypothetical protein